MTAADLIAAEERIRVAWESGLINGLTHLHCSADGEHEQWLSDFYAANIKPTDWVFGSHRAHLHALLTGSYTPDELLARVLSGHSMSLYGQRFVTSAIVAGVCGVAAGMALSGRRTWCFVGDGATDQGGFAEAVWFVDGRDLPCTFIVESNDSSCGVSMAQRGMKRREWPPCVIWKEYTPKFPHAGTNVRPQLKSLTPAPR